MAGGNSSSRFGLCNLGQSRHTQHCLAFSMHCHHPVHLVRLQCTALPSLLS